MGRPEAPLDMRDGPLREFARRLRRLREENGSLSYRQLAKSANFAAPTLARAASGRSLPSWELTQAYVTACGADPEQWRSAWAATARLVRRDRQSGYHPRQAIAACFPARQLPADVTDFVGREAEYEFVRRAAGVAAAADAAVAAPVVVVISGLGGVGKSTFAVHAAHRLAGSFPDGQLFADLHGHDDQPTAPSQAAARFLGALSAVGHAADPVASFRSLTAGSRLLVMLDNAASEAQVSPLLPGSAGCLVIVTSRQALGTLASARAMRLDVFDHDEAVELLSRVAGADRVGHAAATASLVELCGRLPLALRIAGSRVASGPAGTLAWLADRLRDEDARLRHLAAGDLDLSAVFDLSYRPLADLQRRVFRHAGLFPGSDFGAAALAVLADMTTVDVECALQRLVDASLIQQAAPGRYSVHDLLRLYARRYAELESTAKQRSRDIRRLAEWYLNTVDAADRIVMPARGRPAPHCGTPGHTAEAAADEQSASSWYEAERANLVAITRAAALYGHHDIAWRLPVAMRGLLELHGYTDDWISVHNIGWESARAARDREGQGWILNGLGTGHWRKEAYPEAIDSYEKALAVRTELADSRGIAVVLNNLGSVYSAQRRYEEAIECLRQALAIREQLGDELDKSFALNSLGHVEHELGHFSAALPLLQEALRIRRQLNNRNGEAATLHCLGDTLTGLGRHLEALACFRTALSIFRQIGNRYGQAVTMHSLGSTCLALHRPDYAVRYLRRAISLYGELGQRAELAAATRKLAAARSDLPAPDTSH